MTLSLTLVVPCYCEAARLRPERFLAFLDSSIDTRLLMVDDGSPDGTLEILAHMAAARPDRITVLPLSANVGKGEAVRRGLLQAMDGRPDLVGFWDADLSTPLRLADEFRSILMQQPDVHWVLGSRWRGLGRRIERNALRHYVSRVFATAVSVMLELPVYDSQCGAKMFRSHDWFRRLLEEPFVSSWLFDVEMLARLTGAHGSGWAPSPHSGAVEVPLAEWVHDPRSHLRPRDLVRAGWDLAVIWKRYLRRNSRYRPSGSSSS